MNKFENSNLENLNSGDQFNIPEAEKADEENFNNKTEEEYPEGGFNGENDEEIIKKTPEESFVNTEEELEAIDKELLEKLSPEEKEQLEYNRNILEEQLQKEADFLVEQEKTNVEEEVKEIFQEELVKEIQGLEKEGKLDNLVQELANNKPVETNTEGPLKEIAKKDPKIAFEIINKFLKGSQNLLESIKLGYDIVNILLKKSFKEKENKKENSSPSVPASEQTSSEEKRDIFQEIAERRVFENIEEEREKRRKQKEGEKIDSSQNFNEEEENFTSGEKETQQTGSQPSV